MSYLDATGNAEIRLDEPAVFIRTTGADRNPKPKPASGPRLRGPKAWALLRTLAEVPPPFGVRELAEAVDVDPGYVSRVLRALEDELLITRKPRGPVTDVEWEGLIRKAASTYSVFDSNETSMWVATSGPTRFIEDVAVKRIGDWAVTGSVAAARLAPVAGAEVAVIYTDDPERLANAGRLLATTQGANVVIAVPYDPVVFESTDEADGIPYASPTQVVVDCLTGNARMPAEGEAVIDWMRKNEVRWRTGNLSPRSERRGE
ncbi:MAG: MarR family transcriptional regulator [Acidimicrobiales bacterium]|nr:MarR family transcriptional regulator [Acidimicrobiales bacterium]